MEEYISKSALVAEIENLENTYKKCPTRSSYEEGLKDGRLIGYKDALHKIGTLEVKEVAKDISIDLRKQIASEIDINAMMNKMFDPNYGESQIARSFYRKGIEDTIKAMKAL